MMVWLAKIGASKLLPVVLGGVLIASLIGGYFMLRSAWRAEGAATVIAEDAQELARKAAQARKLSADTVDRQSKEIADLNERGVRTVTEIKYVQSNCPSDAALERAADFVRGALAPKGNRPTP